MSLAGFSSGVCTLGLFRRQRIPYICDPKAGSKGADPCPGTGASQLGKITRCTPGEVKINLRIIFLACHR